MKTNYKITLAGLPLFVSGISIMLYELYGDPNFKINVETELLILFGLVSSGLIISGIGLMLEFAARKYEMQK